MGSFMQPRGLYIAQEIAIARVEAPKNPPVVGRFLRFTWFIRKTDKGRIIPFEKMIALFYK